MHPHRSEVQAAVRAVRVGKTAGSPVRTSLRVIAVPAEIDRAAEIGERTCSQKHVAIRAHVARDVDAVPRVAFRSVRAVVGPRAEQYGVRRVARLIGNDVSERIALVVGVAAVVVFRVRRQHEVEEHLVSDKPPRARIRDRSAAVVREPIQPRCFLCRGRKRSRRSGVHVGHRFVAPNASASIAGGGAGVVDAKEHAIRSCALLECSDVRAGVWLRPACADLRPVAGDETLFEQVDEVARRVAAQNRSASVRRRVDANSHFNTSHCQD